MPSLDDEVMVGKVSQEPYELGPLLGLDSFVHRAFRVRVADGDRELGDDRARIDS